MASIVACPKCHTRLKLSKVPSAATKIQCPHCRQTFGVAAPNGVTAKPPAAAAKLPAGRVPVPAPKSRGEDSRQRAPLIGTGAGLAIALAIMVVGVGVTYVLLSNRPAPVAVSETTDSQGAKGQDVERSKPEVNPRDKKKEHHKKELAAFIKQGRQELEAKHFVEAEGWFKKALEKAPDDNDATQGLRAAQTGLAELDVRFKSLLDSARSHLAAGKYADCIRDALAAQQVIPASGKAVAEALEVRQQAEQQLAMLARPEDKKKEQDSQNLIAELKDQRGKELASFIKQGKQELEANHFVDAEGWFKKALDKAPGDQEATQGLLAARAGLVQAELDTRFKNLLDSARSHLAAGRYTDCIRDALAAQQVMPANGKTVAEALEVRQQAEQQVTTLQDLDQRKQEFAKVMDQGAAALRERRFPDAVETYKLALKLLPDDPAATKGLTDAQAGTQQLMAELALLKNQYQAFMTQGTLALNAGLFADAMLNFGEAGKLVPNDPAALTGFLNAKGAFDRINAYRAAMDKAGNLMILRQYGNAMVAYGEALLNVPNDPFALQGQENARQLLLGVMQASQIVDFKLQQAAASLQQQQYVAARDQYLDAVQFAAQSTPDRPDIQIAKNLAVFADKMAQAQANSKAQRFGDAVVNYFEALSSFNNNPVALQGLKQAMDDGQQTYDASIARGKKAMDAKNYSDAVAGYSDALRSVPNNPLIDLQFPALPGLRTNAQQGLDNAQQLGTARYNDDMAKGMLAMNARNFTEAVAWYTDALRLKPNDGPATQGLNSAQTALQAARDFDNRVQQANQLLRQQRYADARNAFNDLVPLAPTPTQIQAMKDRAGYADAMARGQSAAGLKQYPDAVLAYNDALRIVPGDPPATKGLQDAQRFLKGSDLARDFDAKIKLADQLLKLQKYADAGKAFRDAVQLQPKDPQIGLLQSKASFADAMIKGQTAMDAKRYPDALTAFNLALNALPGDAVAMQKKSDAQKMIDGIGLTNDFNSKVKQAEALVKAQNYDQAGKLFTDAINSLPAGDARTNAVQPRLRYASAMASGQSAMKAMTYQAAADAFAAALKEAPGDGPATQYQQQALAQVQGANQAAAFADKVKHGDHLLNQLVPNYNEAGKAFRDALKLQKANPQAAAVQKKANYADAMAAGQAAQINKDNATAQAAYNAALVAMPNNPAALQKLQDVRNALAAGNAAQAAYKAAMASANTAMGKKDYAAAIGLFKQALAAVPNDPAATQGLQMAQQQQAAQAVPPPNPRQDFDNKLAHAETLIKAQRYAEAIPTLNDALKLIPQNDAQAPAVQRRAHYADLMAKGTAAMSQRNFKEAVRQFQIAVNEFPSEQAAITALNNAKKGK